MKPLPIAEDLCERISHGSGILDIGSGTGRNAIYMAEQGFTVDALDVSSYALRHLRASAQARSLRLRTIELDIETTNPALAYPGILCTFVLHMLRHERALSLLHAMATVEHRAVHALGVVTDIGDFILSAPPERFYPPVDMVQQFYTRHGWRIIASSREVRTMAAVRPDGTHMSNVVAFLLAEK